MREKKRCKLYSAKRQMQPTITLILMLAIYNNVGRFTLFGSLVHFNLQFFGLETGDVNLVMHRTLFIERQLCCMVSNLKKTTIFLVFWIKNEVWKGFEKPENGQNDGRRNGPLHGSFAPFLGPYRSTCCTGKNQFQTLMVSLPVEIVAVQQLADFGKSNEMDSKATFLNLTFE